MTTPDINARANLTALQDVMHAARQAGPDAIRVLFEALHRHIEDADLRMTLDAVQAIYNAEPISAAGYCPHFDAKAQLAKAAWDAVTDFPDLAEAPNYRIEGDTSVVGLRAVFRSRRTAPQALQAAE